jgi:hypothetical protein
VRLDGWVAVQSNPSCLLHYEGDVHDRPHSSVRTKDPAPCLSVHRPLIPKEYIDMDIVCDRNRAGVHLLDFRTTEEIPDGSAYLSELRGGGEMEFHSVLCVKL